jgi:hypothetical protein
MELNYLYLLLHLFKKLKVLKKNFVELKHTNVILNSLKSSQNFSLKTIKIQCFWTNIFHLELVTNKFY